MDVILKMSSEDTILAQFRVQPIFIDQIRDGQDSDEFLVSKKQMVAENSRGEFEIRSDGMLMFGTRMCVPNNLALKNSIME